MDPYPILSLVLTSLAVMGSPGPATISITAVGNAFGMRRSLPYLCGLILGTTAVLLAVATGLTAILLSLPHAVPLLIAGSIAYITYLAFRIATAPPLAPTDGSIMPPSLAGGFALGAANPKAYVAIGAVFAANRLTTDAASDAVAKTAILTAMIVVIHIAWLLVGAFLTRILHDPLWSRVVNIALAAALLLSSLWAFLPEIGALI